MQKLLAAHDTDVRSAALLTACAAVQLLPL
jgi:hypothetical protein